jgi:hypothetical protein
MGRGISKVYDVALACAVLLAGCSLALAAVQPHADNGADDLSTLALHTLAYLDRQHVLGRIVYSGDSNAALSTIGCLLPAHLGFRIEAYDANWVPIWSAESSRIGDSGSASYYLSGINGTFMPRIVVLRISR